jgi:hypothetical protein
MSQGTKHPARPDISYLASRVPLDDVPADHVVVERVGVGTGYVLTTVVVTGQCTCNDDEVRDSRR